MCVKTRSNRNQEMEDRHLLDPHHLLALAIFTVRVFRKDGPISRACDCPIDFSLLLFLENSKGKGNR